MKEEKMGQVPRMWGKETKVRKGKRIQKMQGMREGAKGSPGIEESPVTQIWGRTYRHPSLTFHFWA